MITFNLQITNAANEADGQAARMVVNNENARRTALNEEDPPPVPLWDMLPLTPQGALLTSYEEVWNTQVCPGAHDSYILQAGFQAASASDAKERWVISSDAQRQASVDALEPMP